MNFDRKDLIASLILLVLSIAFLFDVVSTPGGVFLLGFKDSTFFLKWFLGSELAQGGLPLWNPYGGFGRPFLADLSVGAFYPFNLLFLFLQVPVAYQLFLIGHCFLAAFFMYLLVRRLGNRAFAAMIAGGVFAFSGPMVSSFYQWETFFGVPWIPLIVLFFHFSVVREDLRLAALTGFILALQFFSGDWWICCGTAGFLLLWSWINFKGIISLKTWGRVLVRMMMVFLGLASVQILPLVHWHWLSEGASQITTNPSPFALGDLVSLVFGGIFPQLWGQHDAHLAVYVGIVPLALVGCAWFARKNGVVRSLAVLGGIAVLALGLGAVGFRERFGFAECRRVLIFFSFSLAGLAGFGLDRLWTICTDLEERRTVSVRNLKRLFEFMLGFGIFLWAALLCAVIFRSSFAVIFERIWEIPFADLSVSVFRSWIFGATLWTGAAILFLQRLRTHGEGVFFGALVLGVVLWELFQVNGNRLEKGFQSLAQEGDPTNFEAQGLLFEDETNRYGWSFRDSPVPQAAFREFENLPRAQLRSPWEVLSEDQFMARVKAHAVSWKQDVLLAQTKGDWQIPTAEPSLRVAGSINWQSQSPNRAVLEVKSSVPAVLVLREANYPGWSAKINGTLSPVLQVNGFLRGVFLNPGNHRVVMEFYPWTYRWGKYFTFAACVALAIYLLHPFTLKKFFRALSLAGLRRD